MKAITVSVYKNNLYKGCSNGGVSEKYDELLLLHERGWFEVKGDEENLCKVVSRKLFGRDVYHVQPVNGADGSFSFGGSYAANSDARLSELIGEQYGAVAIHDRREF